MDLVRDATDHESFPQTVTSVPIPLVPVSRSFPVTARCVLVSRSLPFSFPARCRSRFPLVAVPVSARCCPRTRYRACRPSHTSDEALLDERQICRYRGDVWSHRGCSSRRRAWCCSSKTGAVRDTGSARRQGHASAQFNGLTRERARAVRLLAGHLQDDIRQRH